MNGKEKVIHYVHNGEKTGDGISVVHHKTNDTEAVLSAKRNYSKAKDLIDKTLAEIEVNGSKYQDFRGDKD